MRACAGEAFCVRGNSDKWNSDENGREREVPQKGSEAKDRRSLIQCLTHPRNHAMNKTGMRDRGRKRGRGIATADATGKSDKAGKSKRDMKREEDGK